MTHETFFTEPKLTFNGEKINARISWNADNREWLVEVLASGMALVEYTDTAAAKRHAILAGDDMVNQYIQRVFKEYASKPTDTPAEVDMGGDFEGFVEAVNAPEPTFETILEGYTNASKKVQAGIEPEDGGFYVFVTLDGLTVEGGNFEDKQDAIEQAQTWFNAYSTKSENPRIKQLRNRIASQERELIDLRFELSQLLGGK